ncbi:FAD-dependent oxidoreductase [Saccharomonospora sp.]|uniref:FAD-dependent oxidoreductase n=1 Tax=Saccharomonospora sp. TaxID=33913 RepID=UPI002616453E|nr:FAD-dependent oxidoreductase [Saccharomonospora sp.]
MADRRIVRHRAPAGAGHASALARRPHVVVVGGGIAGLAAATGLAERGVAVEVLEREPWLGGRVASWTERLPCGTPVSMSRGFHAFFRQYYNLRALLRRTDPGLDRLIEIADYPLQDAHGRIDTFRELPRTPPWNALAFALRSPTFRVRDLIRLNARAAAPLAAVSVPGTYELLDHVDAETFLRRINFPPAARHLAFDVFSRSFFAPPDRLSAAELATMFHLYFLGSAEGLIFDAPEDDFQSSLWGPLADYLTGLGATVRTNNRVLGLERTAQGYVVHHDEGGSEVDAVVLATDVGGLRDIVNASPDLDDLRWRAEVDALRTAPPFLVWRCWFDRPVATHRPAFLATGGLDPLDNISVLERYERGAARWTREHGGSVVELHAYAASADADVDELCARLLRRLHETYPETVGANLIGDSVQWRADCPLFGVGAFSSRPRVRTPFPGLVLAGDGIRIDLPVALMERAASTGLHAANCLLAGWRLAGHELHSVPTKGRSAVLRALAGVGKGGVP